MYGWVHGWLVFYEHSVWQKGAGSVFDLLVREAEALREVCAAQVTVVDEADERVAYGVFDAVDVELVLGVCEFAHFADGLKELRYGCRVGDDAARQRPFQDEVLQ